METNQIILKDLMEIITADVSWEKLKNKTILISGANGFLPSYIVKSIILKNKLIETQNTKVIAFIRNKKKTESRFKDYLNSKNLEIIEGKLTDRIKIKQSIDYIIHAASQASPKYYGIDPVGTIEANTLGTYNLLQLAKEKKVRSFLYFSSGEVYGNVEDHNIPTKENEYGYLDPTNVRSCYAESKRMGENMCISFFKQYEVPIKIVRPFHTYGPGMALDDGRVFADFVANILHKQNIVLNSNGAAQRAFCYLSEATIAFLIVLLKGINGEAYNVGNPYEEHSILELAKILLEIKPEYKLKVIINQINDESNYLKSTIKRNSPDISKINELGWNPNISVKEGFTKVIDSFIKTPIEN